MSEHSIGKTIAGLRKEKGWTQIEFAQKLCVTDKAVSKWENETSFPDISQFPAMARLFNVSIDYLLTGKNVEKEIVVISNAELCAKNDDVTMAEKVKDLPSDENGKTIVDYIVEYQSIKVFKKLCENDSRFITRFEIIEALTLATLSNSLFLLNGKQFPISNSKDRRIAARSGCYFTFKNESEIKELLPEEDESIYSNNPPQRILCIIPRQFFTMLVNDKRINEDTLNSLLLPINESDRIWHTAFPYLIEEAYKGQNQDLLHYLLTAAEKNNHKIFEEIEPYYDNYDRTYNYILSNYAIVHKYNFGTKRYIVHILRSTITFALEKGDFEAAEKFNKFNSEILTFVDTKFSSQPHENSKCYVASSDEIRIAKLKLDKTVSNTKLQVEMALHNGILNICEVKNIKDLPTIKEALYMYPIHPFEVLYNWYSKKDWKSLFRFAVDEKANDLANSVIAQNIDAIEDRILEVWTKDKQKELNINRAELHRLDSNASAYSQTSIQDVVVYLRNVRQKIMNELTDTEEKEAILGELTKDFFYSELGKGNWDIVIVKLCVRLEAILKFDYRMEGNFSEMLDHFCNQFNTYDDEGNNYDPYTPQMLNNLRRQRNGIVHSEKVSPQMSDEEIKQCIDYICSL